MQILRALPGRLPEKNHGYFRAEKPAGIQSGRLCG